MFGLVATLAVFVAPLAIPAYLGDLVVYSAVAHFWT
jgi:hypothetical protein